MPDLILTWNSTLLSGNPQTPCFPFFFLLTSLVLIAHAVVLFFLQLTCHSDSVFIALDSRSSVDDISELLLTFLCPIGNVVYCFRFQAHCSLSILCISKQSAALLLFGTWNASLAVLWRIFPQTHLPDAAGWSSAVQQRAETYLWENVTDC